MYISEPKKGVDGTQIICEGRGYEIVKVDSLYLLTPYITDAVDFENLPETDDKKSVQQMIRDSLKNRRKTNEDIIREEADSMRYELNEINGDMDSPLNIEYRVIAEFLDNTEEVLNSDIVPSFVLVNIYVGPNFDEGARSSIKSYAGQKKIPIIIYAPKGRDDRAAELFEQIKYEWNASCGFVAGDVQWDGVLSVAETMCGFMGYPARDWLFERLPIHGLD